MSADRPTFGLNSFIPNNYRSKAEAFAKCLQDKLRSLGGGDEDSVEVITARTLKDKPRHHEVDNNENFPYPDENIYVQHPGQMPYKQDKPVHASSNGQLKHVHGVIHDKRGYSSDSEASDDEQDDERVLGSVKQPEAMHKRVQELLNNKPGAAEDRTKVKRLVSVNSEDSWFSCDGGDMEVEENEEELLDHFAAQIKGSPGIKPGKGRNKRRGRREEKQEETSPATAPLVNPLDDVFREFDLECFSPVNGEEPEEIQAEEVLPLNHLEDDLNLMEVYEVPYRILRESSSTNDLENHFSGCDAGFCAINSLGHVYRNIDQRHLLHSMSSEASAHHHQQILTPPPSPEVLRKESISIPADYVINVKRLDDVAENYLNIDSAEEAEEAIQEIMNSLSLEETKIEDKLEIPQVEGDSLAGCVGINELSEKAEVKITEVQGIKTKHEDPRKEENAKARQPDTSGEVVDIRLEASSEVHHTRSVGSSGRHQDCVEEIHQEPSQVQPEQQEPRGAIETTYLGQSHDKEVEEGHREPSEVNETQYVEQNNEIVVDDDHGKPSEVSETRYEEQSHDIEVEEGHREPSEVNEAQYVEQNNEIVVDDDHGKPSEVSETRYEEQSHDIEVEEGHREPNEVNETQYVEQNNEIVVDDDHGKPSEVSETRYEEQSHDIEVEEGREEPKEVNDTHFVEESHDIEVEESYKKHGRVAETELPVSLTHEATETQDSARLLGVHSTTLEAQVESSDEIVKACLISDSNSNSVLPAEKENSGISAEFKFADELSEPNNVESALDLNIPSNEPSFCTYKSLGGIIVECPCIIVSGTQSDCCHKDLTEELPSKHETDYTLPPLDDGGDPSTVIEQSDAHETPADHTEPSVEDTGHKEDIKPRDKLKVALLDDDDVDDISPRLKLRRCSSLKTWKTPPGTPGRKKIVRFADALGLDLADVRTFLEAEIPKIPSSAYEDLQCDLQATLEPPPPPGPAPTLIPMFQQPGGQIDFLDRLKKLNVSLENAVLTDTTVFTITGCVRVKNLDFNKSVHVRYSIDGWQTFSDLQTTYVPNSYDGFSDKFSFVLYGHTLKVGQQLEFALRFDCQGQQYWDNNGGSNYVFQCLPQSASTGVIQSALSHTADEIADFSKFY